MAVRVELLGGGHCEIKVREFRERRASVYAAGTVGAPVGKIMFKLEREAYDKGREDDQILRAEIAKGLR